MVVVQVTLRQDKIKLDPYIVLFAFFSSRGVSVPSNINFGQKYHYQDLHYHFKGPALSYPISKDLYYCFQEHAFSPRER